MTEFGVCVSRYTGKERDTESGNDYFGARYYASSMGRWMSPDPLGWGAVELDNPQTLNMYSYVLNRATTYIDPDGLDYLVCAYDGDGNNTCNQLSNMEFVNYYNQQLQQNLQDPFATIMTEGNADPTGSNFITNLQGFVDPSYNSSTGESTGSLGFVGSIENLNNWSNGTQSSQANTNAPSIAGCFVKGALVGAAGAVVVGGAAVLAVTVGAPVAAVSATLWIAGAAGAAATAYFAGSDVAHGNYASAAYGVGSLAGGALAGGLNAANTVFGLTGEYGTPFTSVRGEAAMNTYRMPNQSWGQAYAASNAKGPTQAGATAGTGGLGSVLHFLRGGC